MKKKVVRLNEQDIERLVKKIINEDTYKPGDKVMYDGSEATVIDFHSDPNPMRSVLDLDWNDEHIQVEVGELGGVGEDIDWGLPAEAYQLYSGDNTREAAWYSDDVVSFIEEFYDITPKADNPTSFED